MNFLSAYGKIILEEKAMDKKWVILGFCAILNISTGFCAEITVCPENNLLAPTACESVSVKKTTNKCAELVARMYNDRAATYNVLNLTPPQKKCKDEIEKRRYQEIDTKVNILEQELYVLEKLECNPQANKTAIEKQKKVIKDAKKDIDKTMKKYDKEFKTMLCGEQKAKYNSIQRMKRKDLKKCERNKPVVKQDPNLQPFGQPYYYDENACPKHGFKHLFKHKCRIDK